MKRFNFFYFLADDQSWFGTTHYDVHEETTIRN
jgi:hypothetical protein